MGQAMSDRAKTGGTPGTGEGSGTVAAAAAAAQAGPSKPTKRRGSQSATTPSPSSAPKAKKAKKEATGSPAQPSPKDVVMTNARQPKPRRSRKPGVRNIQVPPKQAQAAELPSAAQAPSAAQIYALIQKQRERDQDPTKVSPGDHASPPSTAAHAARGVHELIAKMGAVHLGDNTDPTPEKLSPLRRNAAEMGVRKELLKRFREEVEIPVDAIQRNQTNIDAAEHIMTNATGKKVLTQLRKIGLDAQFFKEIFGLKAEPYDNLESRFESIKQDIFKSYQREVQDIHNKLAIVQEHLASRKDRHTNSINKFTKRMQDLEDMRDSVLREKAAAETLFEQYTEQMDADSARPLRKSRRAQAQRGEISGKLSVQQALNTFRKITVLRARMDELRQAVVKPSNRQDSEMTEANQPQTPPSLEELFTKVKI